MDGRNWGKHGSVRSGADLTGAADVTDADFDGAILSGVKGLAEAKGLSAAKNLDRSMR